MGISRTSERREAASGLRLVRPRSRWFLSPPTTGKEPIPPSTDHNLLGTENAASVVAAYQFLYLLGREIVQYAAGVQWDSVSTMQHKDIDDCAITQTPDACTVNIRNITMNSLHSVAQSRSPLTSRHNPLRLANFSQQILALGNETVRDATPSALEQLRQVL